jgi:signal transduction histidine kinase
MPADSSTMPDSAAQARAARWRRLSAATVRSYRAYANWLVGISWKRFVLLALLLLIASELLQQLPPFSWRVTETVPERRLRIDRAASATDGKERVAITIGDEGVRVHTQPKAAAGPASAASQSAPAVEIALPADLSAHDREAVRQAVQEAKEAIQEALAEERQHGKEAGAAEAADTPKVVAIDLPGRLVQSTRRVRWGDFLTDLAALWIVASIIIKITYKGRIQAEAKAARATETAEAEALKRQVVEARMAAMQAQVEPHFLFNTLASIDHLIETDAPRASLMQKNLIALLRASMPSLRETQAGAVRDLGRELAVVRPYLEILKVRMEERLHTVIDVPEGLLSAEFPPMMLQSLVENAIRHGLEPKPEGGTLRLHAQVVHGKLALSVADSGVGFAGASTAATAGTGVGLANIRERLALLYGGHAWLEVAENPLGGSVVTITVPYRSLEANRA